MNSANRPFEIVFASLGVFSLIFALLITWNGWFISEPHYFVKTFNEVVIKEVSTSVLIIFLDIFIILLPAYLTSFLFFDSTKTLFFRRFLIVLISAFIISTVFVARFVVESILIWQPMERSTINAVSRTFARDRGGVFGSVKDYTLLFTVKDSDFSFVSKEVIPKLKSYGYSIMNFDCRIDGIRFSNPVLPGTENNTNFAADISQVPINGGAAATDYLMIGFKGSENNNSIGVTVSSYPGEGPLTGQLRRSIY